MDIWFILKDLNRILTSFKFSMSESAWAELRVKLIGLSDEVGGFYKNNSCMYETFWKNPTSRAPVFNQGLPWAEKSRHTHIRIM